MMPNKLPYSEVIAKNVRQGIRNGISVKDIMASIQRYPNAPASTATFYKLYGADMAEEKASIVGQIGGVVVQQALNGDFKSQELFLRSKGGWSPTQTQIDVLADGDPDQDESAIDTLMTLLGKNTHDNSEEA